MAIRRWWGWKGSRADELPPSAPPSKFDGSTQLPKRGTPAAGVAGRALASSARGLGRDETLGIFPGREVFREGAENSARGGRAPHSASEFGLNPRQAGAPVCDRLWAFEDAKPAPGRRSGRKVVRNVGLVLKEARICNDTVRNPSRPVPPAWRGVWACFGSSSMLLERSGATARGPKWQKVSLFHHFGPPRRVFHDSGNFLESSEEFLESPGAGPETRRNFPSTLQNFPKTLEIL